MGQRSQIYVKVDDKLIVANYYQWNYAERMISRARYGIEYMKYPLDNDYLWYFNRPENIAKMSRYLDVNFDYKDIVMSTDILKEYEEYGQGCGFSDYVFDSQDNNDGKLFIWIDTQNKAIKYAFTDCEGKIPMTAIEYMNWEDESCYEPYTVRFKKSELNTFERNRKYIEKHAALMTDVELRTFKSVQLLIAKTA